MLFFTVLFLVTGAATVASSLGWQGLSDRRSRMRIGMTTAFIFTGTDHLVTPARYVPMLPGSVPFPREVVLLTGLCEISGALGLMTHRWRRLAAMMLALYLICESPANVKVAVDGLSVTGMPKAPWFYKGRLCLIPVAIWWAWYSGAVNDGAIGTRSAGRRPARAAAIVPLSRVRLRSDRPVPRPSMKLPTKEACL